MADPETTNKGDLEDLFGDSDDEDFQPVEQQQQPLDDAAAAPVGVRPHMSALHHHSDSGSCCAGPCTSTPRGELPSKRLCSQDVEEEEYDPAQQQQEYAEPGAAAAVDAPQPEGQEEYQPEERWPEEFAPYGECLYWGAVDDSGPPPGTELPIADH
jgi:hypothetical protein